MNPAVPTPTPGRIVLFIDDQGEVFPAIVRAAYGNTLKADLSVFTGDLDRPVRVLDAVQWSTSSSGWCWPPRA